MEEIKKLAVIGNPIEHSLSPKIHGLFAKELGLKVSYEAIQIKKENFEDDLESLFDRGYFGLNVTLPLKELAFSFADKLSEESELCGSVNTLWKEDSLTCADSTDGRGLVKDLKNKNINPENQEIVILGAGGSAKAIIPSLLKAKPKRITIANRTISKAKLISEQFSSGNDQIEPIPMSHSLGFRPDLVINTTSAGVLNQGLELPTNLFFDDTHTYDLSYSIEDTPFLKLAKSLGAKLRYDGLGMLIEQAALSFEIWTKQKPQTNLNKVDIL